MDERAAGEHDAVLSGLAEPALRRLSAQLGAVRGLAAREQHVLLAATASTLRDTLRGLLSRLLTAERHGVRVAGGSAPEPQRDPTALWDSHYPTLLPRVRRL